MICCDVNRQDVRSWGTQQGYNHDSSVSLREALRVDSGEPGRAVDARRGPDHHAEGTAKHYWEQQV